MLMQQPSDQSKGACVHNAKPSYTVCSQVPRLCKDRCAKLAVPPYLPITVSPDCAEQYDVLLTPLVAINSPDLKVIGHIRICSIAGTAVQAGAAAYALPRRECLHHLLDNYAVARLQEQPLYLLYRLGLGPKPASEFLLS